SRGIRTEALHTGHRGTIGHVGHLQQARRGSYGTPIPGRTGAHSTTNRRTSAVRSDTFEQVTTSDVRLESLGYPHRAVRLLVVLQDRHDPTGGRERAVERGGDLCPAVRVPVAHAEAARLERGAVRGRGQLAVAALRRHPALAVELARGRGAQVAGCHVD